MPLSSINSFLWDTDKADEDRAAVSALRIHEIKTNLTAINGSYPTTGVKEILVERYVGAMQMKSARSRTASLRMKQG